jgi:hypothetical protein
MHYNSPDYQLYSLILHHLQPIVDEKGEAALFSFGKRQTAKSRENRSFDERRCSRIFAAGGFVVYCSLNFQRQK